MLRDQNLALQRFRGRAAGNCASIIREMAQRDSTVRTSRRNVAPIGPVRNGYGSRGKEWWAVQENDYSGASIAWS